MKTETTFKYVDYDYTEITPIWECQGCGNHYSVDENEFNYCPYCGSKVVGWKGEDEFWTKNK